MNRNNQINGIRFVNQHHKVFFFQMLSQAKNDDRYHQAFFYTMGICEDTRRNIHTLFNFQEHLINPDGLAAGWQTSGSRRICFLAFNLWNGWTEEGNNSASTPYDLFDCGYAPYFFEAIRLRYPEYCHDKEQPISKPFEHTR